MKESRKLYRNPLLLQIVEYPKLEVKNSDDVNVTSTIEDTSADTLPTCMQILKKEENFEKESCRKLVEDEFTQKEQEATQALIQLSSAKAT